MGVIPCSDLGGLRAPSSDPKFLNFHGVFGKSLPNNRLAPLPVLVHPPLGNPGSAIAGINKETKVARKEKRKKE